MRNLPGLIPRSLSRGSSFAHQIDLRSDGSGGKIKEGLKCKVQMDLFISATLTENEYILNLSKDGLNGINKYRFWIIRRFVDAGACHKLVFFFFQQFCQFTVFSPIFFIAKCFKAAY